MLNNPSDKVEWIKGKQEHSCPSTKEKTLTKEVNANTILTNNQINELGYNLIKQHLVKPLSFHIDNLKKNTIQKI